MANTFTQINIHAVFCVKGRGNVLSDHFRPKLFSYINGILNNHKNYSLAVNGYKDHVHIFFELNPSMSVSDVLRLVKTNSSRWINENGFVQGKFEWQEGYGAFSYSKSQRNDVIEYIKKQEEHHGKDSFRDEYLSLLRKFDIEFDDRYLFEFYDD